jgi:hypothetical protein
VKDEPAINAGSSFLSFERGGNLLFPAVFDVRSRAFYGYQKFRYIYHLVKTFPKVVDKNMGDAILLLK